MTLNCSSGSGSVEDYLKLGVVVVIIGVETN